MATDNKDNRPSIGSGDYAEILRHTVAVIEHARTEIAQHVNGYVSTAYWEIGQMLHERKIESGYGDSVIRRLSADLKERYPKMGVSPRQLWNMKKFYERYAGHDETTLYYAQETVTKGWNRDLLLNAIKLNMYETQALAKVDNNFDRTLPAEQAQYANEVFSISYNLGFLGVTSPILELEDMGKPIGVADYQLIVPKEKLQKVLADEIKVFSEEKEIRKTINAYG